ncbi:MAG: acyl-CoA thioesterase [Fibrobacter sp.]|nr:acyl-CoA thioesterase [Fibrobacter sp.]
MSEPIIETSIDIEVAFYEVDPMQIMWHGNYINFMERARCALLEKIGYTYIDMEKDGYGWPVVDVHVKYIRPLQFRQKVRVTARITEYEFGLRLTYTFVDIETGKVTTKAETTQMAVNIKTRETNLVSPRELVEKIEAYRQKLAEGNA